MGQEILVALITGLCVAIPSVIATYASHNKSSAIIAYQVGELKTELTNLKTEFSKYKNSSDNDYDELKQDISKLELRIRSLEIKMGLYHKEENNDDKDDK